MFWNNLFDRTFTNPEQSKVVIWGKTEKIEVVGANGSREASCILPHGLLQRLQGLFKAVYRP